MIDQQEIRWMVTFGHSQGGSRTEHDFPRCDFWHPCKEASIVEGKRVLNELALRGDKRDWYAAGYPDPFEVGSGKHSGDSWIVSISDLT